MEQPAALYRRNTPIYPPAVGIYGGGAVTKRLVDIDDGTLDRAKLVLGTDTIKDTVNAALNETVRAAERRQHVDRDALKRFAAAAKDLADDDVMRDAWR